MTVDSILRDISLTEADAKLLSQKVKESAVGCGKSTVNEDKKLSAEDWSLVDEISDTLWYSEADIQTKVVVGFQLFNIFPSYFSMLNPYYDNFKEGIIQQQEHKDYVWKKFMGYLAGEVWHADPVGYILWVEFFENPETVSETWQGLMNFSQDKKTLLRLIESAGPVPFELKEPIYQKLMKQPENHESIFKSLLYSAYDLYGSIDRRKARMILSRLRVDTRSEKYHLLTKKLK